MNHNSSLGKNIFAVITIAILVMILAFGLSLWLTPKYKAASKMIVVFNDQGMDAYTASKNSSYITSLISEVAYSNIFINSVYENNFALKDDLGYGQNQRLKEWKKHLTIKTQESKGIIIVETFYNDNNQAYQLNQSVVSMIAAKHGTWDGFQDKATIKTIDNPAIVENWFQLKVIQNSLIGLALGLFLGFSFVVIFPQQQIFKIFSSELNTIVTKDEVYGLDESNQLKDYTPYNSQWMDYSIAQNNHKED